MIELHPDFERELQQLIARLAARFSDELDPADIEFVVRGVARQFESATVMQFLPILVERRSIPILLAARAHRSQYSPAPRGATLGQLASTASAN